MKKQTIYLVSYPKSGSTWLANLLGDALNSSTAGSIKGALDIVTKKRPGPYLIRRGHYILVDNDTGPVVPQMHQLAWKRITDEKIIFMVRDPRDICVSGAWHWQVSVNEFLEQMIRGEVAGVGRWDEYCDRWLNLDYLDMAIVKYRRLRLRADIELSNVLNVLNISFDATRMCKAIEHQSFATRKAEIGESEAELRRHNMRKGIVGDWRNHFTPEMNDRIWQEFGRVMERLGYDQLAAKSTSPAKALKRRKT